MPVQRRIFVVSFMGLCLFIMFNGMLLLSPSLPSFFSGQSGETDLAFNWATQIGYVTAFLLLSVAVYFWAGKRFANPFWLTTLLYLAGFLLLVISKYFFADIAVLSIFSGLLIGAGSSCCLTTWVSVFRSLGKIRAQNAILLGSVLGILPNVFILFVFPGISLSLLVAVLLSVDLILLFLGTTWAPDRTNRGGAGGDRSAPRTYAQKYRAVFSDLRISFVCVALLSFISPIAGAALLDAHIDTLVRIVISVSSALGAAAVLFVCWRLIKIPVTFERLCLVIFPLLATTFILLVILNTSYWPFFLFMGDTLFELVSMVAIYVAIALSLDRRLNVAVVFGAITGTMYLARLLGWVLGTTISIIPAFSGYQLPVVVIVLLYGFSIFIYFVLRSRKGNAGKLGELGGLGEKSVPETSNPESDFITARSKNIAESYCLSGREQEILDLLAHGRDIPAISKILYISPNTVRTHTKKLYGKLDIHTRQELIDLLERRHDVL